MDAEAEFQIFDRLRSLTKKQMVILISHQANRKNGRYNRRFVRGTRVEQGTHENLLQAGGRYARLFSVCKRQDTIDLACSYYSL